MIILEMEAPTASTAQWKYLFENGTSEAVHLTNECKKSELFCTEDGQRDRYETTVETHKFPMLYERVIVSTRYNMFDFDGKSDKVGSHVSF